MEVSVGKSSVNGGLSIEKFDDRRVQRVHLPLQILALQFSPRGEVVGIARKIHTPTAQNHPRHDHARVV